MSVEKIIDSSVDRHRVVPTSLIREEPGKYKEKAYGGTKTGSPKKRRDNEISLSKYHDSICKFCDESSIQGIFLVKYKNRKIRKDKRIVDYICDTCMEEKGIATIDRVPDDISIVGGLTKEQVNDS